MPSNPPITNTKLSPIDFSKRIKSKYPGMYDDLDDTVLTRRMLSRFPTYNDMVDLPDLDKPLDFGTIEKEAAKFGLQKTSGERNKTKNKSVGGVANSYHLPGDDIEAGDYSAGDRNKHKEFYNYMRDNYGGRFKEILNEGDHVHIASRVVKDIESGIGNVNNIDNVSSSNEPKSYVSMSDVLGTSKTQPTQQTQQKTISKSPIIVDKATKNNSLQSRLDQVSTELQNLTNNRVKLITAGTPHDKLGAIDQAIYQRSQEKSSLERDIKGEIPEVNLEKKLRKTERKRNIIQKSAVQTTDEGERSKLYDEANQYQDRINAINKMISKSTEGGIVHPQAIEGLNRQQIIGKKTPTTWEQISGGAGSGAAGIFATMDELGANLLGDTETSKSLRKRAEDYKELSSISAEKAGPGFIPAISSAISSAVLTYPLFRGAGIIGKSAAGKVGVPALAGEMGAFGALGIAEHSHEGNTAALKHGALNAILPVVYNKLGNFSFPTRASGAFAAGFVPSVGMQYLETKDLSKVDLNSAIAQGLVSVALGIGGKKGKERKGSREEDIENIENIETNPEKVKEQLQKFIDDPELDIEIKTALIEEAGRKGVELKIKEEVVETKPVGLGENIENVENLESLESIENVDIGGVKVPKSSVYKGEEPIEVIDNTTIDKEPNYVYRVRDIGETGVPSKSHSQATNNLEQAKGYIESRESIQGKKQELVKIDLNKLSGEDYELMDHPSGAKWIKFKKDLGEENVEKFVEEGIESKLEEEKSIEPVEPVESIKTEQKPASEQVIDVAPEVEQKQIESKQEAKKYISKTKKNLEKTLGKSTEQKQIEQVETIEPSKKTISKESPVDRMKLMKEILDRRQSQIKEVEQSQKVEQKTEQKVEQKSKIELPKSADGILEIESTSEGKFRVRNTETKEAGRTYKTLEEAKERLKLEESKGEGSTLDYKPGEKIKTSLGLEVESPKDAPDFVKEAFNRQKKLQGKKFQRSGGPDTQELIDHAIIYGHKAYKKGIKFIDWADEVVKELGNEIVPYLERSWELLHDVGGYVGKIGKYRLEQFSEEGSDVYLKAEKMDREGRSNEEIFKETGWFKGRYDNKWRYGLSDEVMKFTPEFDLMERSNFVQGEKPYRLDKILYHPALFEAYPELREVNVIRKKELDSGGWFSPDTNTINVSPNVDNPLSIIRHEIQHWIQAKEGFAFGGSARGVYEQLTLEHKQKLAERVYYEEQENIKKAEKKVEELNRWKDRVDELKDDPELEKLHTEFRKAEEEFTNYTNKDQSLDETKIETNDSKLRETEKRLYDIKKQLLDKIGLNKQSKKGEIEVEADYPEGFYILSNSLKISIALQQMKNRLQFHELDIEGKKELLNNLSKGDKLALDSYVKGSNNSLYDLYTKISGEIEARDTQNRMARGMEGRKKLKPLESENIDSSEAITFYYKKVTNAPEMIKEAARRLDIREGKIQKGELKEFGSGGPNTKVLIDKALVRGYEVYEKVKDKVEWVKEIVKEFGEEIRPHLGEIWKKVAQSEAEGEKERSIAIVGIGKETYKFQMEWLDNAPIPEWIKNKIKKGEFEHYDMQSMPEKGDVIDSLDKHSAIIGMHLFGVKKGSTKSLGKDYFYNRENDLLIEKANKKGISVFLMGDQPNGKKSETGWGSYEVGASEGGLETTKGSEPLPPSSTRPSSTEPQQQPIPEGFKQRSLPKTLESHSLPGGKDRVYEIAPNDETLFKADAIIQSKGIDGAIEYLKTSNAISAEHTATGLLLIEKLIAENNEVKATNIAEFMSKKLTEYGQAVQAVQILNKFSPAKQLQIAEKTYRENHNEEQIPVELAKEITSNAKRIQDEVNRVKKLEETLGKLGDKVDSNPEVKQVLLDGINEGYENIKTAKQKQAKAFEQTLSSWQRFSKSISKLNVLRAIEASVDLSAAGRQGMIFSVTHPYESSKAFYRQLQALAKNPKAYREFEQKHLFSDSKYEFARQDGVEFTTTSTSGARDLNKAEEAYMNNLFQEWSESSSKIKKTIAFPIIRSEQAYVTFLNHQRLSVYKLYSKALEKGGITREKNSKDYKYMADFINKATGRGNLGKGKLNEAVPFLNSLLFSPKYLASRFQLLAEPVKLMTPSKQLSKKIPQPTNPISGKLRRIIARDLITFTGAIAATLLLTDQLRRQGHDVETSLEPDDPDFLKIRLGTAHYDISGGFQSELRFIFQVASYFEGREELVKKGSKLIEKGTGKYRKNAGEITMDFARRKLAPLPGFAAGVMTNTSMEYDELGRKKPFKRPITLPGSNKEISKSGSYLNEGIKLFSPITIKDMFEAYKEEGIKGIVKASPGALGIGTSIYKDRR